MLVGPTNEGVCESIVIIERMDQLTGTRSLLNFDDAQREKYEKLKELHQGWNVEAYAMGHMYYSLFFFGAVYPQFVLYGKFDILDAIRQQQPSLEQLCVPKYKQQLLQYADFKNEDNYRAAGEFAIPIVKMCEEWLIEYKGAESYPKYVLGNDYSMADVLFRTILSQAAFNPIWFAKHIESSKVLNQYWQDFRSSKDFEAANIFIPPPPLAFMLGRYPCTIHILFAFMLVFPAAILACLSFIITNPESLNDTHMFLIALGIAFAALFLFLHTLIACCKCKHASKLATYAKLYVTEEYNNGDRKVAESQ